MKLRYKLIFGDCEEVMESMEKVDLVVTSPPYYTMRGHVKYRTYAEYLRKMERCFRRIYEVLKYGRVFALNVPYVYSDEDTRYFVGFDLYKIAEKMFRLQECIVWVKDAGAFRGSGSRGRFSTFVQFPYAFYYFPNYQWEFIFVFTKGKMRKGEIGKGEVGIDVSEFNGDVWRLKTASQEYRETDHPAMFPSQLPRNIISFYSYEGDVVLDPFLGSGTTMAVAKELGRSCIGIEIEEKYEDVIKRKVGWNQQMLGYEVEYEIRRVKEREKKDCQ